MNIVFFWKHAMLRMSFSFYVNFMGVTAKKAVGLFVAIFYFLKKKAKGFPLQSLTQILTKIVT